MRRYDIVLIQEIRDISETTIPDFLRIVNKYERNVKKQFCLLIPDFLTIVDKYKCKRFSVYSRMSLVK